ncbi:MAG: FeoB-associated Cys-rich membrane protein [Candidatus Hydrogenedentes bacterium]|nr:FeoB-associated Cys-rich membrane protein [Candidatus Hydrogenedentota bacterium]
MTGQAIIVAAIISAAVIYLGRRWYRALAGKSTGCGCSECPSKHSSPKKSHS